MDPTPSQNPSFAGLLRRLIWHAIPFILVFLVVVFLVIPLNRKITEKKAAVEAQRHSQDSGQDTLTNVTTLEMIPQELLEKISLPGVARPWISLEVVSEVQGKVIKKIDQGRPVETGDMIALIDPRDYQNSYDSALAAYETALTTLKRYKALSGKQFVTAAQLDDADAQVRTSKAAMENAKLALDRCTIRSPMAGMVNRTFIEVGSFLGVGDPVAGILQMDKLKIEVGIPESDVDAVRKLSRFDITVDALDSRQFTGTRHYLYKSADPMARLYNLEIKVDNSDGRILPDMFARVAIVKHKDPEGLAVPTYALVTLKNQTGVFVENQGTVRFRQVVTGFQTGWLTQISQGLTPGEQVVVLGHRIIEDNEPVHVTARVKSLKELSL